MNVLNICFLTNVWKEHKWKRAPLKSLWTECNVYFQEKRLVKITKNNCSWHFSKVFKYGILWKQTEKQQVLKYKQKRIKIKSDCSVRYFCKSRKLWVNGLFNTIYIKIITGFSKCVVPVRKIHHCIFNRVKKSQIPFIQLTGWKSAAQILKDWFKCMCSIFVQCIPIISCIYLFK